MPRLRRCADAQAEQSGRNDAPASQPGGRGDIRALSARRDKPASPPNQRHSGSVPLPAAPQLNDNSPVAYQRADGRLYIDDRTHAPMVRPNGFSIKNTVRSARMFSSVFNRGPAGMAAFAPGGVMDLRRQYSSLRDKAGNVLIDKRYIAIGNYNFGVYAAASGMARDTAQLGASVVYNLDSGKDSSGPYGNNPVNARQIRQGYDDYMSGKLGAF
jgi:hypothetical protein